MTEKEHPPKDCTDCGVYHTSYTLQNNARLEFEREYHHVILTKHGEDVYVKERTVNSQYPNEEGRIENVIKIEGNLGLNYPLILTLTEVIELRDILEIFIEKEDKK